MRIVTRLNVGGPAYQAILLSQRLQDAEFQSRLVIGNVGPAEGSLEGLASERGVAFVRVPGLGREISPHRDLPTLVRLLREIRRYRPHLVHTHLAKAGAIGRFAARLARVPAVVHTYHGHVFHGYFSPLKSQLFVRIERALARWTDRLIVLGEAQEREILGYGVGRPEQMVRIPLGLELEPFLAAESFRGEFRRQLGIPVDAPLVGIVARLVPIKAHDLFLAAARRVADQRPAAHFAIVGDGELRPALAARAAALGFDVIHHDRPCPTEPRTGRPAVHFVGLRSDLPTVYADLDVVVLSSRNEGLPVSLIEALAAARPVVATRVGAVEDLVIPSETGLLVPPGDEAALAEAILAQLDDPVRAQAMGARGRRHVFPRFSIDRLEQEIRRLYRELLATVA